MDEPDSKKEHDLNGAAESWQAEFERQHGLGIQLLQNIKARLPELQKLLEEVSSRWHAENGFRLGMSGMEAAVR
jgi:hypothetical protein